MNLNEWHLVETLVDEEISVVACGGTVRDWVSVTRHVQPAPDIVVMFVPGESLRLVVMERVPWPRPTVLHAARRMAGGGSAYDDRVVRAPDEAPEGTALRVRLAGGILSARSEGAAPATESDDG